MRAKNQDQNGIIHTVHRTHRDIIRGRYTHNNEDKNVMIFFGTEHTYIYNSVFDPKFNILLENIIIKCSLFK